MVDTVCDQPLMDNERTVSFHPLSLRSLFGLPSPII
jgi:hypothetical protein